MSSVLYLALSHLGLGIAATLLLVGDVAGVKFFRFNAGLAGVLLLIALAFRPDAQTPTFVDALEFAAMVAATAAILFYWGTIGRVFARLRRVLLPVALAAGAVSLVAQAVAAGAGEMAPSPLLTAISFFSSAALLGGTCTAMTLGHWYLVLPSMEVSQLQTIVKFHIGSTVVRTLVVAVVIGLALATWQAPSGAGYASYATSVSGVFLWQRVLFGLLGPAVLSYLTWETAKIQATQSATGILYVDFFTVVVGEVLAKYLLVVTRVPL